MQHPLQEPRINLSKVPTLLTGEKKLHIANSVDFLGLRLGEALDWGEQLDKIEGKLAKDMFVLRNFRYIPAK